MFLRHLLLLALLCPTALLMGTAFHVGNQTTSLGSETGIRFPSSGGCPDLSYAPAIHVGARFESYANGDPISSLTDQGSQGSDFSQITGSAQPTARVPCESGKMNNRPCAYGDGGDLLSTASFAALAQPNLLCAAGVSREIGASGTTQAIWADGNDQTLYGKPGTLYYQATAGVQLNAPINTITEGVYDWVCVNYSGSSSTIWKNGSVAASGNIGAGTPDAFDLFGRAGLNDLEGTISEVLVFDSVTDAAAIVADVGAVWGCVYGEFPQ
jgi:hypothetical protein